MALYGETVIVYPVGSTVDSDADGLPIYEPSKAIVLTHVNVQPATSRQVGVSGEEEPNIGRLEVRTYKGDPHPEITVGSTVSWRGFDRYRIVTQPQTWLGIMPHTEFQITRAEG